MIEQKQPSPGGPERPTEPARWEARWAFSIPKDRPVVGEDLLNFKEAHGMTVDEVRSILGISLSSWSTLTRKENFDKPISHPSLALLLRVYSEHPEMIPPKMPEADIRDVADVVHTGNMSTWGPLLGYDAPAGYRWFRKGQRFPAHTKRLAAHMIELIRKNGLDHWRENYVEVEARARGVENVLRSGSWQRAEDEADDGEKPDGKDGEN